MWKRVKKLWFLVLGVLCLPVVTLVALGRYTCGKIGQWWRKKSLWRKVVVVVLLSIFPVLLLVDCAVGSYRAARRRDMVYMRDIEYVGSNLEIHYFNRGESKLFNRETNSYTLEGVEWISNVLGDDSLAVYSDTYRYYTTSKRGYININTGEVVIPATEYSRAWLFSEGMAVGVVLAGALSGQVDMSFASVLALSAGIALQNIPEGAVISLPLRSQGVSRLRSFSYGMASGTVEPISAIITILLIEQLIGIFPYMLAFAAGAMIYVVVEELIPEAHSGKHSNLPTIGFAIGFAIMMVLDVALS